MTATHIMFLGVIAAVAAILLAGALDLSIGVVAIFLIAFGTYAYFLRQGSGVRRRG
jgi:hypothetical protein